MKIWFVSFFCAVLLSFVSRAQEKPTSLLQLGISMNSYKGELSNFGKADLGFDLGLKLNNKPKLNGGIYIGFGSISGEDVNFRSSTPGVFPNQFFKSNYFYLHYELNYHFVKKDKYWVYAGLGLGVLFYTPYDNLNNKLADQPTTRLPSESYGTATLILPLSVGGSYFLNDNIGLDLKIGLKNTMTKYLDNIAQAGNNKNDNLLSVRLSFMKFI